MCITHLILIPTRILFEVGVHVDIILEEREPVVPFRVVAFQEDFLSEVEDMSIGGISETDGVAHICCTVKIYSLLVGVGRFVQ